MKNTTSLTLEVRKFQCKNCEKEFKQYYLSDFAYGERLIYTEDRNDFVYVNCIQDKSFNELGSLVKKYCQNKNVSVRTQLRYFNKALGAFFDRINGKQLDATKSRPTCIYCNSENITELIANLPIYETLDVPILSHDKWELYSPEIHKKMVTGFLDSINNSQKKS